MINKKELKEYLGILKDGALTAIPVGGEVLLYKTFRSAYDATPEDNKFQEVAIVATYTGVRISSICLATVDPIIGGTFYGFTSGALSIFNSFRTVSKKCVNEKLEYKKSDINLLGLR